MDDAVIEWFDSHCHLQDEFTESDDDGARAEGPHATRLAAIVARASEAGVTRMVCVGTAAGSSRDAVALVRSMREPGSVAVAEGIELWATVGLHPHDAADGVDSLDELLRREVGPGAGTAEGRGGEPGRGSEAGRNGASAELPVVVGIGECGLDYHYDHSPRADQREAFARQIELARRHGLALVVHTREAWDDTLDILSATGVPDRTIIHCFTGGPLEARR
ncbi:MAG TPA: TatD family hydrolase, partial [Acidimicrobiales bacterium]|nr:TatD family hydrolase [Acidimicrobiales bacterium]